MKLGAVALTERFLNSDPPRTKALDALRTGMRAALSGLRASCVTIVG